MPAGLYADFDLTERWISGAVSTGNVAQPYIAPCDLEIQGVLMNLGTAPASTNSLILNISNSPTSQLSLVSAYNLWTAANAPRITGTATNSFTTSVTSTVVKNLPYALNYPLPGPSGTVGYNTAQSTAQTTETPVTSPPTLALYQLGALVVPDNTYSDYNGVIQAASYVHAGDILTFVLSGTAGSSNNLEIMLYALKR